MERVCALVINLDRRPDRLATFLDGYQRSDLGQSVPLFRYPAVDGSKVDIPGTVSPLALQELSELARTGVREHHSQLTKGAVGCYLSHLHAWQWVVAQKDKWDAVIIFEDDALFESALWNKMQSASYAVADRVKDLPVGIPWMLLFNATCLENCSQMTPTGLREPSMFWELTAYLLTPSSAQQLLTYPWFPVDLQIDSVLSKLSLDKKLHLMHVQLLRSSHRGTDIQTPTLSGAPLFRDTPRASPTEKCAIL